LLLAILTVLASGTGRYDFGAKTSSQEHNNYVEEPHYS